MSFHGCFTGPIDSMKDSFTAGLKFTIYFLNLDKFFDSDVKLYFMDSL